MEWDLNPFLAFTGNMTFFRTEVVNEDEALRCINKAIEIDEKIKIRKYLKVHY